MLYWKRIADLLVLIAIVYVQKSSTSDIIPKIIDQPQDVTIAKNSNVELRCKASGKPKPKIYWLRDGRKVPTDSDDPDRRRFIMPSGNLTFIRVIQKKRKTDSGKYQCVAENKAGKAISNPATLIVGVLRSQFKTEPRDRTVTVGNSVILKCNPPRGRPVPTVSWLKDGLILQPDGSRVRIVEPGSLYISIAQKVDQGKYVCQATNPLGQKQSKAARLTVKELPSTALSVRPKRKVITAGTNVVFHCEYRDGPQGAIRWYKKGGTLPENRFETTQYGELKIKNSQPDDGGEYVCSVSNSLSATAKLIVQTKPFITTKPVDVIVREGAKAKFLCRATGNPEPTVFWDRKSTRKPMFPHQDNGRFVVKTTGELVIENVKPEDQGEYVCSALSQAGVSTASTKLTVVGKSDTKPLLVSSPTIQTIQESEDAIFLCKFNGVPTPTIQWHKDSISLSNSSKYQVIISGYKTQLKIKSGQKGDEGQYVCTATNILGSAHGTANLVIKSTSTTLPPLPVINLESTTTSTPVVPPINQLSPPSDLIPGSITTHSILLLWTSVKPGKLPITYTVEYKKSDISSRNWKAATESTTANSFFVMGLEPDTVYEFSVRAKTAKSQSKRTTAMYKTDVLKMTPKPVISKKHGHVKVLVNVEPMDWDKLNITWMFDRHTKRKPSGFNVFWKKQDSFDGYEKVLVMGDGIQEHVLNKLSANTSYVIQVQVFFNKHKLPKTNPLTAITGAKDNDLVIVLDGGIKKGAESDVKIIQADTRRGGTWARVREFVRKPWFIAIMGGVLWIILLVIVLLLYRRRRRNQRQLKQRKLKLQIAEIQRAPASPQGHKTLWMDDVNTTDPPPQLPANNRISDTSSTECLNRSVTSCCARRGITSNATGDFPNKITLNSLADPRLADANQFDISADSKLSLEGKPNNIHQQQSINNYREHLNKSAKFEEGVELASIGSQSGSESTLPRAMPQQTSFLTPTQQFINRKKANARSDSPASQQNDPNKTPDDSLINEKTKPKLKIQSFDVASNGSIPGTTTFHADPPPTYEAVLKETELEKQLGDGNDDEQISKSKEELADKLKAPPFSDKPALRTPSPPLSERSCKTTSSCGSRKRKVLKPPPRLAILNWADLLPPPPSHPPPSSLGSPPPSPPFSLRSGMSGMSGLTGMSGMTGLTGMTGMTGMTGRTGKSSANGTGDSDLPERLRKRPGPPSSAVSESVASAEPKVPGSSKSKSSKHKKSKPKAMPIDLEGITSDIIMQWADSVTNTSGSDDDSSCSSPSRVSSTGSFFTDADFASAVRAAAECGGFNMETYGLMDSLGYPPPYSGSWKQNNSVSNGSEPSGPTMNPRPPTNNKNKWETGSEGDLEFTPPITVRPRYTRKVPSQENGAPPPVGPSKMATDMGIRKVARSPVPIVPSQPRRPIPRAARNHSNSPVPATGQIIVQPLKKTYALSNSDVANRSPVTKKFAVVKKIPQSKDSEPYNSATLSSSGKSSTSTASTVKTSTMGDSDDESAA